MSLKEKMEQDMVTWISVSHWRSEIGCKSRVLIKAC